MELDKKPIDFNPWYLIYMYVLILLYILKWTPVLLIIGRIHSIEIFKNSKLFINKNILKN